MPVFTTYEYNFRNSVVFVVLGEHKKIFAISERYIYFDVVTRSYGTTAK
jgi:hypothetical protein